ncbi:MAG: CHAP domain-containing protein [Clostridiales bacterium]|nr:CHAP domain-containing protein [Clostridiales bacterium]
MKNILTILVTVMMGAAFIYVPAVSFAAEQTIEPETQQELTVEQIQRNQVVETAKSQVGYLKGEGDDKYTLEARALGHSATQGWCGRFVWWCFYTTDNASAYYDGMFTGSPRKLIDWASENDLLIDKSQAQPGDILIKMYEENSPHAGIIESIDSDGTIHTIERNHYKCEDGVYQFTRPAADYFIRPQYGM